MNQKIENKEQNVEKTPNYLDKILNLTEEVVNKSDSQDLKTWHKLKKEFQLWKKNFLLRKERLENATLFKEPLGDLEELDENQLLNLKKRNFLSSETFHHLKEIDRKLFYLRNKKILNSFEQEIFILLKQLKKELLTSVEEKYELKKEKVLINLISFYKQKLEELNDKINSLEKNEALKNEIENIKNLEEKELEKYFQLLKENLISVESKNNRAFAFMEIYLKDYFFNKFLKGSKDMKNVDKILNKEFIKNKILSYYNEDKENKERYEIEKGFYNELRSEISKVILKEEIDKTDLIPSEMKSDGLDYIKSFNFICNDSTIKFLEELSKLKNNQKAVELLERIKRASFESKVLLRLFKKRNKDGSLTKIWQIFDKKSVKEFSLNVGLAPEAKEIFARKLEQDSEFKKFLEQENTIPVFYFKKVKIGNEIKTEIMIGGVKLRLDKLADGTKIWVAEKVIDVLGLKEGAVSDYDMSSFPVWVKNAAKVHGLFKEDKKGEGKDKN